MHRSRAAAVRTLLASLAVVLSACGTSGPTGAPAGTATSPSAGSSAAPIASAAATSVADPNAVYAAIEQQVRAIRGLQAKRPVEPQVLDAAGIRTLTSEAFTKDNPPDVLAANERILKAFGLLPADASLTKLYIDLLGSQVAGLYSPDDKKLYVVSRSGGLGVAEKSTFSHEYTHALQDQNFDIATLKLDEVGQGDRSFARLALVEGDATLAMSYWQLQNLSQAELGQLIAGAGDDESTKALLTMPAILRESLLFPYIQGLTFVQGIQTARGWGAVDDVFAKPPASTEQILHPDKYAAGEVPLPVDLPAGLAARVGAGWTVALEDTFGEFQLAVWLRGNTGLGAGGANDAAAGWGGDRVAVVNGPNGAWGVILRSRWDSDVDAAAFETAAGPLVQNLSSPASILPGGGGPERWVLIGSDDASLAALARALGLAG
ncbi:MAG: hypothetical protein QOF49_789 [Chloroflexota bacterium]|nr:hypothetical protein [Chloroflexota bacterium]